MTSHARRPGRPRAGRLALEFDDFYFEVDPSAGGRVTAFCLGDVDVLAGRDVDAANYGSTLWTSPQSDWGWPPPAAFDREPYAVVESNGAIGLVGKASDSLGVLLEKRFSPDRARGAIRLEYVIRNVAASPKTYAPWEVSRVHPGGLTFFPTGAHASGPLAVERRADATWFSHDPAILDDAGKKHSADGLGGFVAHAASGLLFVKAFGDLLPEEQAPGEGEVEIYGNNRYVEIEVQGPYARIGPFAAVSWAVTWTLAKLPVGLPVTVGNAELLALASTIAG